MRIAHNHGRMISTKIHLGCGAAILDGWANLDIRYQPGVNVVANVTDGIPFTSAQFIFAEHFIEHFYLEDAIRLLANCRSLLEPSGVLRLSTPNLDWVWVTSYASRWNAESEDTATVTPARWDHDDGAAVECVEINKAFRAWGHRFLFNKAFLGQTLKSVGFDTLSWVDYGQSDHPDLRDLETHERQPEIAGVSDVLVVEASCGQSSKFSESVAGSIALYHREFNLS